MHTRGVPPCRLAILAATLLIAASCGSGQPVHRRALPGLHVTAKGVVTIDGIPYRGIGVNYFDAFYRSLKSEHDTTYDAGFTNLARKGIPFARVMAGGYWPSEQRLYLDDPHEFFRRLDGVVRSAERHRIGLILSLFWHPPTVPDLVGEPVSAWGDVTSKTHAHMREYVARVVERYVESPAVWGWEFGNEYSLGASLPNPSEHRWPVEPQLGTAAARTEADDLTVEMVRIAYSAFAREVRRHDHYRMISSGNSVPRDSAWHNWQDHTFEEDSSDQAGLMLRADNPPPLDVISMHAYAEDISRIPAAAHTAQAAERPLFLGEFGALGPGRTGEADLRRALQLIEDRGIPLAALWVYDFSDQPEWSVTATNDRSWQLDLVAVTNAGMRARR
jgi:hypothetical protein